MSCRLRSSTTCWRLLARSGASQHNATSLVFARPASDTASSTGSPPTASSAQRGATILDAVQELRDDGPAGMPPRPRKKARLLTLAQIRDAMVNALATRQPRRALQVFLDVAARRGDERLTSRTMDGFAWLFCQYRQPALARQAAAAMHAQDYEVTPRLASRLLRMSHHDLILQPDVLAKVLAWLSEGMVRESHRGKAVDEGMLETVLDVLKRMGRSDWLLDVFKAYRGTLAAGQPGSPRLWAIAISAKTSEGDVRAAQELFSTWRGLYESPQCTATKRPDPSSIEPSPGPSPPPPDPYLALLDHFAAGTTYIASRDPAYKLVAVATQHGVELSTKYLNALLRTELHRRRWGSFWGLWEQFEVDSLVRDESSWALAIRAKLWSEASRRQRGRLHESPLHAALPFVYAEAAAFAARALLGAALAARHAATHHRPSRVLSTKQPSSLTPDLLNLFLDLFITRRDWSAAALVLETFSVHRLEPDARTHSAVVLGVVRLWERGKLRSELIDDERSSGAAYDDAEELRRRRRAIMGGPQGVELIRKILEGRQMRVGLWTGPSSGIIDGEVAAEGAPLSDEEALPPQPPTWMAKRETRELGYLATLLRRCAGLSEEEWGLEMAATRKEVLPEATSRRVKKVKSITRNVRFREQAYGKAAKVEKQ